MASRGGGVRPVGTDGNDFMHRQRIASQYSVSAENKKYVKYAVYMHAMLSIIVVVQLAVYHAQAYYASLAASSSTQHSGAPDWLPDVPKPNNWQYIWLLSLVPALAGHMSLQRNRLSLIKFYYYGTLVFGFATCFVTMIANAEDLMHFARTKETSNTFHDFPVIVLWYIYLFVVIQIHAFGIYFARVLIKAWSNDSQSRTKTKTK